MPNASLPIYKLTLSEDPDSGIQSIALVDDPAIQRHFLAFRSQKEPAVCFRAADMEQHIISGPLMVADMCILRNDEQHGEHYVYFDAPTIRQLVLRFFRHGLTSSINLMHIPDARPDGIFMFESFMINAAAGIAAPKNFDPLPDGSWFGSFKVDNPVVWDHFISTGEFKGFSVEGFFAYNHPLSADEMQLRQIAELIENTEA